MPKPSKSTGGRGSHKIAPAAKSTPVGAPHSVRLRTANMPELQAAKIAQVETMSEAMPFNASKPGEHGFANALAPLLDQDGVPSTLTNGDADPGMTFSTGEHEADIASFIAGIAHHRDPERETDPSMV
jgi:hypothetical protein